MNTYNLFCNGQLLRENVTIGILTTITGINPGNLARYVDTGKEYRSKDGKKYTFTINTLGKKTKRKVGEKEILTSMPEEWIKSWNNMYSAAKKIREGTHHIVSGYRNGKFGKYTEAIK